MQFSRPDYWHGQPSPSPEGLPNPGICQLKKHSHNLEVRLLYLVGMFRTWSPGDSISVAEKTASGRQEGKSGYIQVCSKGSRLPEHQGSGIKLRNSAFCVREAAGLWARWIHPFHMLLSYRGPSCFLVHPAPCGPPAPQQSPQGVAASLHPSFESSHSHVEARNPWWLGHFLFINMAGHIFISQVPVGYHSAIFRTIACLWNSFWDSFNSSHKMLSHM